MSNREHLLWSSRPSVRCPSLLLDISRNSMKSEGKGKGHPRTGHEGPEGEKRYSCILSLTSSLDGVGERQVPAALPPRKTRYRLYSRLGVPQRPTGRVRKTSLLTRFDPRTVQPVASRYTN